MRFPAIISDNMVLQQNTDVAIWGWGQPGEKVKIQPGWKAEDIDVVVNDSGKWNAVVKTPKAGGPYTITIKGNNTIELKNVLIGEIWIASGQSNIGQANCIHPANKKDVGERLARWALAKDYGKDVDYSGPLYAGYHIEGDKIRVYFDYAENGLLFKDGQSKGFAIAGPDRRFVDGVKSPVENIESEFTLPTLKKLEWSLAREVTLEEVPVKELPVRDGWVEFSITKKKIMTIELE